MTSHVMIWGVTRIVVCTHKPGAVGISPPLISPTSLTGRSPAVSSTTSDIMPPHSDSTSCKAPVFEMSQQQTCHTDIHCKFSGRHAGEVTNRNIDEKWWYGWFLGLQQHTEKKYNSGFWPYICLHICNYSCRKSTQAWRSCCPQKFKLPYTF